MAFDGKLIEERIRSALRKETELSEMVANDIAFHMADWLDDLARYVDFCSEPDKWKDEGIDEMLLAFLVHVPNHVAAASKLLTGIPVTDVFGVGAIEDESNHG